MANDIRQAHFNQALDQLVGRMSGLQQDAARMPTVTSTQARLAMLEGMATELAALAHGATLLSDRLADWAADLLENARS
jgi:hypothetical protein